MFHFAFALNSHPGVNIVSRAASNLRKHNMVENAVPVYGAGDVGDKRIATLIPWAIHIESVIVDDTIDATSVFIVVVTVVTVVTVVLLFGHCSSSS